jgi:hypothetical protein
MTDYSFHKGETWVIDAKFEIDDGDTLSAVSFALADRTGTLLTIATAPGIQISDAAAGLATITITDIQQAAFSPAGRYTYEARITTGSGIKEVQASGTWVVLPTLHS